jgi:hypothetical protein
MVAAGGRAHIPENSRTSSYVYSSCYHFMIYRQYELLELCAFGNSISGRFVTWDILFRTARRYTIEKKEVGLLDPRIRKYWWEI